MGALYILDAFKKLNISDTLKTNKPNTLKKG